MATDDLDRPFSSPPSFDDETTREFKTRVNRDLEYIGRLVFTGKVLIGIAATFATLTLTGVAWMVFTLFSVQASMQTLTGVVNTRMDSQQRQLDGLEHRIDERGD